MSTKAWRDPEFRRSTTFEDLQAIINCSTRIAILVALSGGPLRVKELVRWLGFRSQVLSNHLALLRQVGLVDYDAEGGTHLYAVVGPAPIAVTESGLAISMTADDGSKLSAMIVSNARIMRTLQGAIAASKAPRDDATRPKVVIVQAPQRNGSAATLSDLSDHSEPT